MPASVAVPAIISGVSAIGSGIAANQGRQAAKAVAERVIIPAGRGETAATRILKDTYLGLLKKYDGSPADTLRTADQMRTDYSTADAIGSGTAPRQFSAPIQRRLATEYDQAAKKGNADLGWNAYMSTVKGKLGNAAEQAGAVMGQQEQQIAAKLEAQNAYEQASQIADAQMAQAAGGLASGIIGALPMRQPVQGSGNANFGQSTNWKDYFKLNPAYPTTPVPRNFQLPMPSWQYPSAPKLFGR